MLVFPLCLGIGLTHYTAQVLSQTMRLGDLIPVRITSQNHVG
jgi:hypothetical protein